MPTPETVSIAAGEVSVPTGFAEALVHWSGSSGRPARGRLQLRTLVLLRWLALAGQSAAVVITAFGLGLEVPLLLTGAVIGLGAAMNIALWLRRHRAEDPKGWDTARQLGFDVIQLSALLTLTGGLNNPFCLLLIAPVTIAAATLPTRQTMAIGLLALAASAVLFFWARPLPWYPGEAFVAPTLYRIGVWTALVVGVLFTAGYAWRTAAESARMELALTATQSVLAREQQLAALGGLAAAAAHELGTPLATIQVVARELLRASPPDDPVAEDARLLLQQADRCREILKGLSQRPETGDAVHARLTLRQLLEEVANPHRAAGPRVETSVQGPAGLAPPEVRRLPEVVHGLSAFVENAVDFALYEVRLTARHDANSIDIEVSDDGPGFAPEVLTRLGEPYVTSRPEGEASPTGHQGLGLGFFIAKTLLERTGARVRFGNRRDGEGAVVRVVWSRGALEA